MLSVTSISGFITSQQRGLMSKLEQQYISSQADRPPIERGYRSIMKSSNPPENTFYDDDDNLNEHTNPKQASEDISIQRIKIMTFPDFPAIPKSVTRGNLTILINLKALRAEALIAKAQTSRLPVDLVTVLDVTSSMAGPKIALLKRGMRNVIQNMGPHDRLSVIVFSSVARLLFPLRWMTDTRRHQALRVVDSLMPSGGTDISEALEIARKVIVKRRSENRGCSVILFYDGLDTYTRTGPTGQSKSLLPNFIGQIPVHTFGFGADRDDVSMELIHSSGGAFTYTGDEGMVGEAVQNSLRVVLGVVAHEVTVSIECVDPSLVLNSINAGPSAVVMTDDGRKGVVNVGDLYGQEERDFLVTMDIPKSTEDEMVLLNITCTFGSPATRDMISLHETAEVRINRPGENAVWPLDGSIEVDRQRNKMIAAKAKSDVEKAMMFLERCCGMMSDSISVRSGDEVSVGLVNELRDIGERMANHQVDEASGL